jgi:UDP-N-acetylmuramoyl-L-alanyl-D-glutamate--2,6-diaminopimelate ligase
MRLHEMVAELPGVRFIGDNPEIHGLATDSRSVKNGDLFVAIRGGEEKDRHPYVKDAIAAGAVAAVVEEEVESYSAPLVEVPSTRNALGILSKKFYGSPDSSLKLVGITGTNGKTTTAYLIHALLTAAQLRPGLVGTVEYLIGNRRTPSTNSTPEAHQLQSMFREMVEAGCQSAVVETTSHGLALGRVAGMDFDVGVFTNLTRDHLDFHKTQEAYMASKALLFDNLKPDAHAVVNVDDSSHSELLAGCRSKVMGYGYSESADVRITNGQTSWRGSKLSLDTPAGTQVIDLALQGKFNFWNAAAAMATGFVMGVASEVIAQGVRDVKVPGRFEAVDGGQSFGVVVDYAHTPDGLKNVLETAKGLTNRKLICVFGCGGDRDRGKRPEMGRVAAEYADFSFVTSDNPRTEDPEAIVREIIPGMGCAPHSLEVDRRKAIEEAIHTAKRGDLVLIAGKGHEDYQEIGRERIHFDDREVAREILGMSGP